MSDVRANFERCRPWIEAALVYANGTHDIEDIWAGIIAGQYQFWPAAKGCFVTEVIEFPRKRVFHVFLAGGELRQLKQMVDSLESFANGLGCHSIMISGRTGWARVLKDHGVRPSYQVMAKEL